MTNWFRLANQFSSPAEFDPTPDQQQTKMVNQPAAPGADSNATPRIEHYQKLLSNPEEDPVNEKGDDKTIEQLLSDTKARTNEQNVLPDGVTPAGTPQSALNPSAYKHDATWRGMAGDLSKASTPTTKVDTSTMAFPQQ